MLQVSSTSTKGRCIRMKTQELRKAFQILLVVIFFSFASVSLAAQSSPPDQGTKDVKEKVSQAAEAIKAYSFKQRDEAIKKAKVALNDMDNRITDMESKLDKKWNEMDKSAREKGRATLAALRKQRNDAAEWYGGLKHSSSKAWGDVKKGFLKSYKELQNSVDKAYNEF